MDAFKELKILIAWTAALKSWTNFMHPGLWGSCKVHSEPYEKYTVQVRNYLYYCLISLIVEQFKSAQLCEYSPGALETHGLHDQTETLREQNHTKRPGTVPEELLGLSTTSQSLTARRSTGGVFEAHS